MNEAPIKEARPVRFRLTNPFFPSGPRCFVVRAECKEDLRRKVARYRDFFEEVRLGIVDKKDVIRRIEEASCKPRTLSEAWEAWARGKEGPTRDKAESTWARQVEPLLGQALTSDLTNGKLLELVEYMKAEGYAPNTARLAVEFLRSICQNEVRLGHLSEVPFRRFRFKPWAPPRRYEKAQSVSEWLQILSVCKRVDLETAKKGGLPDLLVRVVTITLCALRKGEASALGWDDLSLERSPPEVRVGRTAHDGWKKAHPEWERPLSPTKGRTLKAIPLHPACALALGWQRSVLQHLGLYSPQGPVFPARFGGYRPNGEAIRWDQWRMVISLSKVPNPSAWVVHSLRHSAASLEALGGATLEEIRARTGHSSLSMVEHYLRQARTDHESRIGGEREARKTERVDLAAWVKAALTDIDEALRGAPTMQRKTLKTGEKDERKAPTRPFREASYSELRKAFREGLQARAVKSEVQARANLAFVRAYRKAKDKPEEKRLELARLAYRKEKARFMLDMKKA